MGGAGERAQQLRTLAALLEDKGSIPRTHRVAGNGLKLQVPGSLTPSYGVQDTSHSDDAQIFMQEQHPTQNGISQMQKRQLSHDLPHSRL